MAHLAENVQPAVTAVQEGFNGLMSTVVALTDKVDFDAIADDISAIFEKTSAVIDYLIAHGEETVNTILLIGAAIAALKLGSVINTLTSAPTLIAGITELLPLAGATLSALSPIFSTLGSIAKGAWAIIAAHPFVAIIAAAALFGDEIQAILQKVDDFMQNVFAADWSEVFGPVLGDAMNDFRDNLSLIWDDAMQILNGFIDFVQGVFTANWEQAWQGFYDVVEGIIFGIGDVISGFVDSVLGWVADAWNALMELWNGASSIQPTQSPNAINSGGNTKKTRSLPEMANGGILNFGSAIVGEAGPELLTILGNGKAQVTPLTNNSSVSNIGGDTVVNVYVAANDTDSAYDIGRTIGAEVARTMRGRGTTQW